MIVFSFISQTVNKDYFPMILHRTISINTNNEIWYLILQVNDIYKHSNQIRYLILQVVKFSFKFVCTTVRISALKPVQLKFRP